LNALDYANSGGHYKIVKMLLAANGNADAMKDVSIDLCSQYNYK